MNSLSTHVLDTVRGCPAAGLTFRLSVAGGELLLSAETDADGRCPRLPSIGSGRYRFEFEVAAYFRRAGLALTDPPFLDVVAIDFGVAGGGGHYHVPLLVSPFAYSTYRGS